MSYIVLTQPHPLDKVWELAVEAVSDAQHAMDQLGSDFEDHELDAAGAVLHAAQLVVWALPARHLSDTLFKLSVSGVEDGGAIAGSNVSAIINEGTALLDAAVARGVKLKRVMPDLLEGVIL